MPPRTSQGPWFIFNTKDQTQLACPLTTWVFILPFKYYKHVPIPGPLHMPCGFCLPRFHRLPPGSWLLRVQFTVPLPSWALPLCPHFHTCSHHPVPSLHTHPSPVSICVCLGNDNGPSSLLCFQGLEEYSHPSVFMGDWFWDPLRYPDLRYLSPLSKIAWFAYNLSASSCVLQVGSGFLVHTQLRGNG